MGLLEKGLLIQPGAWTQPRTTLPLKKKKKRESHVLPRWQLCLLLVLSCQISAPELFRCHDDFSEYIVGYCIFLSRNGLEE